MKQNVEDFLDLFADIEGSLKEKLGLTKDNATGMATLISEYARRNP
jgi:hypothetical protein